MCIQRANDLVSPYECGFSIRAGSWSNSLATWYDFATCCRWLRTYLELIEKNEKHLVTEPEPLKGQDLFMKQKKLWKWVILVVICVSLLFVNRKRMMVLLK